tara:strand:- start:70 stop:918 length:849 start_codon:yes stop_codon:yes gene_type:complete
MPNKKKGLTKKEYFLNPSTIETIDTAVYKWLDDQMNLFATTNKGWEKVPVIWASAERAYQIKNDKELRDDAGTLIFPLITLQRNAISKDMNKKGFWWGNIPPVNDYRGGSIEIMRRVNQNKTSNFANAAALKKRKQFNFPKKNSKIVHEIITIPMPVYLEIGYTITIRTEYQQQMNELFTPFATRTGAINYFTMLEQGHTYEGFIESTFGDENTNANMGTGERKYQSTVSMKILGYVYGDGTNQEKPKVVIRETQVDFKIPRERVIAGDALESIDERGFYKE